MKWRVRKKQQKRYERKFCMILLEVECPVMITKRRKTILRLQKVKSWMLNEVTIRYTIFNSYTNYIYSRSRSLETGGKLL
nr:MAG TPA: hypothetical protein [Caudoviricetes sp.]